MRAFGIITSSGNHIYVEGRAKAIMQLLMYCHLYNTNNGTDEDIQPVYTEFKGWNTDLTHCRAEEELPQEFRDYIAFMEQYIGVPIKIISVGPDREATIER